MATGDRIAGVLWKAAAGEPALGSDLVADFRTKREAELFLAGVETKKADGTYIDPSSARR